MIQGSERAELPLLRQLTTVVLSACRRIHVLLGSLALFSTIHKAEYRYADRSTCKNGLDLCGSKVSHTGLPMASWTLAVTIIELRFEPVTNMLRRGGHEKRDPLLHIIGP